MKYKVGDRVILKRGHSESNEVTILEEVLEVPGLLRTKSGYKIYIPYWDYFYIFDSDIKGKVDEKA